jgi:hypothetical protein
LSLLDISVHQNKAATLCSYFCGESGGGHQNLV